MTSAQSQAPALMSKHAHRTPRYICNRTRQALYERAHSDHPWLTPKAIRLLETLLRPTDRGVEWGSGRSTVWFAERVATLTSVEHDKGFYESVSASLAERGLTNVDYILAPYDRPDELGGGSDYARAALAFPDESVDFSLVDGAYRDWTAKFVLPKLKPGGLLIIDNVNWYLPCASRAPNSRTPATGPKGQIWTEVAAELSQWRSIWTTSGVWDTAMFIKPAS